MTKRKKPLTENRTKDGDIRGLPSQTNRAQQVSRNVEKTIETKREVNADVDVKWTGAQTSIYWSGNEVILEADPVWNATEVLWTQDTVNIIKTVADVSRVDASEEIKNISITLEDIDISIEYYFKNVIKPTVEENNEIIDVPVKYGHPELWKSIQKSGYVHDKKGKLINPIIIYRRTGMSRDDGVPVDKASGNIMHQFPIKWSNKNRYDRFSILTNTVPTYEVYSVVMPDYVLLTYECSIWTSYVPQMNKIVEAMQYAEGQFWGDASKFKFSARIDSFDQNIDINTERGRIIKSDFTINIRGYLVPEVAQDLVTTQKTRTVQQVVVGTEVVMTAQELKEKLENN